MSWSTWLRNWELIELDLHSHYGVDVESGVLAERSSRWLTLRILGLLSEDTRLRRALYPEDKGPNNN